MAPSFKPFKLALIQLGNITANKADNIKHAREMILKATAKQPDLIVLPECFNSPYGHVHFPVYAEKIGFKGKAYNVAESESESVKMLSGVAKETKTWLIGGSIPERDGEDLFNTCTVYNPEGELVAIHRKVHLFDIDIPGKITFKESETLTGGSTMNFFDTQFARIGLGICYDVRFPELAMISARQGCHMVIYPGAFNTTTGPLHWELLQRARAVDNQVFFAMCSPARDLTAGYHAWGHSMVVDPMAKVLVEASEGEDILYADIDPSVMDSARAGIPVTKQRRFDVYPDNTQERYGMISMLKMATRFLAQQTAYCIPLAFPLHIPSKYYDLLEVPPNASEGDLKKAYRKKALRLHPDKGGDPELFKEVTHAYEVLSDPDKRSIYDARGEAGLSEQGGMGGMDPQDLFSQLFGGGGGFGGGFFGGGGSSRQGPRRTKDLVHRVHVTLEDLYKGKTTKLALTRNRICSKCKGKGGKEGAVRSCNTCSGRGIKVTLRQMGPMIQQIQSPCDECSGTGEVINPKDRCAQCKGKKVMPEKKFLEVHIDKGMKTGQTIQFRGESDESPTAEPGDVVIVIEEKPHERFKRKENDLITEIELDLLTALGGGEFAIKHLDDRALVVKLEPGEVVKHEDVKVIHGQGMPSQRHHEPGDLYVRLKVNFPESIDPAVIPLLEKALPSRKPIETFPKNIVLDEVSLDEPDTRSRGGMRDDDDRMDEDGDEPRVQCANQ
ncbi:mitochondrial protein import protein mas5 [Favolaschia claudopus]|uniref:Mitochondrial protein import protein mas5 n=1 Tax=Favolaschia claudopus TaxID=2862362 RepID=A0AAW0BFA5_9AGAR